LREARRRCYRTIDKIILPNKQYRSDIGMRCWEDIPKLESWKWVKRSDTLIFEKEQVD